MASNVVILDEYRRRREEKDTLLLDFTIDLESITLPTLVIESPNNHGDITISLKEEENG